MANLLKKAIIKRAEERGTIDRVCRLMSAAYILNCVSNNLISESEEVLRQDGLMVGDLGRLHKMFVRASDRYCQEFAAMVGKDPEKVRSVFRDLEAMEKFYRMWSGLSVTSAEERAFLERFDEMMKGEKK